MPAFLSSHDQAWLLSREVSCLLLSQVMAWPPCKPVLNAWLVSLRVLNICYRPYRCNHYRSGIKVNVSQAPDSVVLGLQLDVTSLHCSLSENIYFLSL